MTRKTASDFDPEVLKAFDLYVHGDIDRRGFSIASRRLGLGIAGAAATLEALQPRFAEAEQVQKDDSAHRWQRGGVSLSGRKRRR